MSLSDSCSEIDEILEIGIRCKELRKEKELLRESQWQSFELIKKLEHHVSSLSEARAQERAYVKQLERELSNCSQEIDYLQDLITSRNVEVSCLEEHVRILESRLADTQGGQEKVDILREELRRSDEERDFLMHELEKKELERSRSTLCIEKLEESMSSVSLESLCEIEKLKLDLRAREQMYFEAVRIHKKAVQEKANTTGLLEELREQLNEAQRVIGCLDEENKELREKLSLSEKNARMFSWDVEEYISRLLNAKESSEPDAEKLYGELRSRLSNYNNMGESFVKVLSQLALLHAPGEILKEKMEKMSVEIKEYEQLVRQLKEELREEKLKAKEETEDMAQEMAELRYQITGLLEEECKKRAYIEQVSLQRIAELEAQVQKEQRNSSTPFSIVREQKIGYF